MSSDVKNCAIIAEHHILEKAPADLYYVYKIVWEISIIKYFNKGYLSYAQGNGTKLDSSGKRFLIYRKMRHKYVCQMP